MCWFCVSVFLFSFFFLVLGAVGVGRFVWGGGGGGAAAASGKVVCML